MGEGKRTSRFAFTLVELLVVICVIAVLSAILMPAFVGAREKARQAACLSNERQMGLAEMQYAQDNDDVIVPWSVQGTTPAYQRMWCGLLQPYLKNGQNASTPNQVQSVDAVGIFKCPSYNPAALAQAIDANGCDGDGSPGSGGSGYIMNPAFVSADYAVSIPWGPSGAGTPDDPYNNYAGSGMGPDGLFHSQALNTVQRPAQTMTISDGWTGNPRGMSQFLLLFGCEGANAHTGGGNYIFLDGHAKYVKGNPFRYESKDDQGLTYMTYLTYDR